MFRKILIAAVASLALLAPLAFPAQSDAHGGRGHRYAGHRYVYRGNHCYYYYGCHR